MPVLLQELQDYLPHRVGREVSLINKFSLNNFLIPFSGGTTSGREEPSPPTSRQFKCDL